MKLIFKNEPLSSATHLIGAGLAIAALVLMIVFAALNNASAWHIVSFSIFGTTLILLYITSGIYHSLKRGTKLKAFFAKLDHSLIFILIAGTYTPILLVPLRGALGWTLFAIVWSIAIIGTIFKFTTGIKPIISAASYIAMGWIIIFAINPLLQKLSFSGFIWLLIGGISYTIGAIFFMIGAKRPKGLLFDMHEIFHLFVMIGSFSHFWVMLKYIIYI